MLADRHDQDGRTLALRSIPDGVRVLVIGSIDATALGDLEARGCTVGTVDVAEAQAPDLDRRFPGDDVDIDIVVLLDVLPHISSPKEVVARLAMLLGPDGHLIASVPNRTHWEVGLRFLRGEAPFEGDSRSPGAPPRLYDSYAIDRLLQGCGLATVEKLRVRRPLATDEVARDPSLSAEVLGLLGSGPEADTREFVVVAAPGKAVTASPSLAEELQTRLHETECLLRDRDAEVAALEHQLQHLRVDLALKDDFAFEQSSRLRALEDDADELRASVTRAKSELAARDAELAFLRDAARQLEEVTSRPAYRLLERLSRSMERHPSLGRTAGRVARLLARRA